MFTMSSFKNAHYLSLLVFLTLKEILVSACWITNVSETWYKKERDFANISYTFDPMKGSQFLFPLNVKFEVCENNNTELKCNCIASRQSENMNVSIRCTTNKFCMFNFESLGSFEIRISYPISRPLSALQLSLRDSKSKQETLKMIYLEVLYPPKVILLTVDGREVNGHHLITEGQKVNISCSFEKGNPPASFYLLDNNSQRLNTTAAENYLNYTLSAQCSSPWSSVRCEGNGSEQNKSVSFAVACPPQFTNKVNKISVEASNEVRLPVKAHTTHVTACYLESLHDESFKDVNCTLTGHVPDLVLNLQLSKRDSITEGNWTLTLLNEEGSANTTLSIIQYSRIRQSIRMLTTTFTCDSPSLDDLIIAVVSVTSANCDSSVLHQCVFLAFLHLQKNILCKYQGKL
ncbi:uncharacterized protein LOC112567488 [Pomacea canaliculata]|uniref:uncharacterized protein LOC112567488 n=1 Tax=Pomacea canaliculata TaxID=400727 RepID=UPI000D726960|nr:uncharacterized protein LOC112567488 [Pomacea canaliculata]